MEEQWSGRCTLIIILGQFGRGFFLAAKGSNFHHALLHTVNRAVLNGLCNMLHL